jgi:peptide methionine sulfoxide reductase msrA/msrB
MKSLNISRVLLFIPVLILIVVFIIGAQGGSESGTAVKNDEEQTVKDRMNSRLDPDAFRIIEQKGTERPFTGEYWDNHEPGIYVCGRCGEPLYESDSKFDSGCGWPSFDDEIDGAVTRVMDADGRRTEILCSTCDAHLGHVFIGEGFTDKNTRHCVNSLSMRFVPAAGETGRAVFAGGCFWGVEHFFRELEGVLETSVGYTGGTKAYPAYQDVSYTNTGHVEAIEVLYDPAVVTYRDLAKMFFEIHDPTQSNGQGPDIGDQYLSKVFYENEDQKKTAEELISILKVKGFDVVTELEPASAYWIAEEYHQDYYIKTGKTPYCHVYTKRF